MIDWARVRELHDEIGEDGFSAVLDMFLAEVGSVVDRLQDDPNPDRLAMDLHFLKGSVLNLGFTQVASLCHEGEGLAAGGQAAIVDIPEVVRAYDLARQVFLSELPHRLRS